MQGLRSLFFPSQSTLPPRRGQNALTWPEEGPRLASGVLHRVPDGLTPPPPRVGRVHRERAATVGAPEVRWARVPDVADVRVPERIADHAVRLLVEPRGEGPMIRERLCDEDVLEPALDLNAAVPQPVEVRQGLPRQEVQVVVAEPVERHHQRPSAPRSGDDLPLRRASVLVKRGPRRPGPRREGRRRREGLPPPGAHRTGAAGGPGAGAPPALAGSRSPREKNLGRSASRRAAVCVYATCSTPGAAPTALVSLGPAGGLPATAAVAGWG